MLETNIKYNTNTKQSIYYLNKRRNLSFVDGIKFNYNNQF